MTIHQISSTSDLRLCVVSTDQGRTAQISFSEYPFTAAGYQQASADVHEPGSTACFRGVGVIAGDRVISTARYMGATWTDTANNILAHLGR